MVNNLTFAVIIVGGQLAVIWLAYRMGFDNGWLTGWEERRGGK